MFFFFFQAEDGIRDLYVTGVQTCALPISSARLTAMVVSSGLIAGTTSIAALNGPLDVVSSAAPEVSSLPPPSSLLAVRRSEERRVGKEGRCGGSPYG